MNNLYHLPHIDNLFDQIQGLVFSMINLTFSYNHLRIRVVYIHKIVFRIVMVTRSSF